MKNRQSCLWRIGTRWAHPKTTEDKCSMPGLTRKHKRRRGQTTPRLAGTGRGLVGRNELERNRIHAIAKVGGRRSIVEHVPQMGAAASACHLVSLHAQRMVGRDANVGSHD